MVCPGPHGLQGSTRVFAHIFQLQEDLSLRLWYSTLYLLLLWLLLLFLWCVSPSCALEVFILDNSYRYVMSCDHGPSAPLLSHALPLLTLFFPTGPPPTSMSLFSSDLVLKRSCSACPWVQWERHIQNTAFHSTPSSASLCPSFTMFPGGGKISCLGLSTQKSCSLSILGNYINYHLL